MKTLIELIAKFKTERDCHQYLAGERWRDGVIECPYGDCENDRAYVFKNGITYKCCACKRNFTAKTDTFMEASKLSTIKWLIAMHFFMHKKGISSVQLSKELSITQKSAWFVLARLRAGMGNEPERKLKGIVEIDEAFVGGKDRFKHRNKKLKHTPGRNWKDKTPILGMLERQQVEYIERPHKVIKGKTVTEKIIIKPAYVICNKVPDVTMLHIHKNVIKNIEKGSYIMGDGFQGYRALEKLYQVRCVDHSKHKYVIGEVHTNTIEGNWSQFKRGICGTYHKTTPKYLQMYINEFAFRYNYRNLDTTKQIGCLVRNMNCRIKLKDLKSRPAA